jgi:hypothetical protein
LASGIPFLSNTDLRKVLDDAEVPAATADAIVEENEQSRIAGLRAAVAVLAICALLAFIFASGLPTRQAGAAPPTAQTPER